MDQPRLLPNYLWQSALLTLIAGAAGSEVYVRLCPANSIGGFVGILMFFFLTGVIMVAVTDLSRKKAPARTAQVYLLTKGVRMILAVVAMAAYCIGRTSEAKGFLLASVAYYLIYLIYDSWFFAHYGRRTTK